MSRTCLEQIDCGCQQPWWQQIRKQQLRLIREISDRVFSYPIPFLRKPRNEDWGLPRSSWWIWWGTHNSAPRSRTTSPTFAGGSEEGKNPGNPLFLCQEELQRGSSHHVDLPNLPLGLCHLTHRIRSSWKKPLCSTAQFFSPTTLSAPQDREVLWSLKLHTSVSKVFLYPNPQYYLPGTPHRRNILTCLESSNFPLTKLYICVRCKIQSHFMAWRSDKQ